MHRSDMPIQSWAWAWRENDQEALRFPVKDRELIPRRNKCGATRESASDELEQLSELHDQPRNLQSIAPSLSVSNSSKASLISIFCSSLSSRTILSSSSPAPMRFRREGRGVLAACRLRFDEDPTALLPGTVRRFCLTRLEEGAAMAEEPTPGVLYMGCFESCVEGARVMKCWTPSRGVGSQVAISGRDKRLNGFCARSRCQRERGIKGRMSDILRLMVLRACSMRSYCMASLAQNLGQLWLFTELAKPRTC